MKWLLSLVLVVSPAVLAQDAGVPPKAAAKKPLREVKSLRLLYFHASWCPSCRRLEASGALDAVKQAEPELRLQVVDVDTEVPTLDRYGVEVTPTLVLVDADGFPLARPRIELDDGPGTAERILAAVRKSTGRR
ncbi:MAG: thioredoxin family protein [Myxococcales bacterium]|nr:thioredoxin family protein [Myxococcales bacterium]